MSRYRTIAVLVAGFVGLSSVTPRTAALASRSRTAFIERGAARPNGKRSVKRWARDLAIRHPLQTRTLT